MLKELNGILSDLMKDLDILWNASDDVRYKGEHPGCDRLQEAIQFEIKKMGVGEMKKFLESLSGNQLEQILFVLENIVDEYPFIEKYIT